MLERNSTNGEYVAYLRVSTRRQGRSGLGLESQKSIIEYYAKANKAKIIQEFIEVESGKEYQNRPLLNQAIELCKEKGYTLIVAKIDRLSRDVKDTFTIVQSLDYRLIACDIPQYPIDTMILAVSSAFAQQERELISIRTKRALDAKKARGEVIVRTYNLDRIKAMQKMAQKAIQEYVKEYYTDEILVAMVEKSLRQGLNYREISDRLNKKGFRTRRKKQFNVLSVLRLIRNIKKYYLTKKQAF